MSKGATGSEVCDGGDDAIGIPEERYGREGAKWESHDADRLIFSRLIDEIRCGQTRLVKIRRVVSGTVQGNPPIAALCWIVSVSMRKRPDHRIGQSNSVD